MDDKVGDEATFDEEFVSTEARMKEKRSMSTSMKQRGVIGGRKDRHSKVLTARGSRDRRVRLSPKTAILFYDVQDRLGCDRPSKAIDWLINEAKPAIDALLHHHPPAPPPNLTTNADHVPISGFGFFNGGEPTLELQELVGRSKAGGEEYHYDQQQFLSPLELFDANSEILRLQGIFSWNYADADNFHYPASADFYRREPLQSTYSTINGTNSPQFQGFGSPDQEMPNFKDDEINFHPPF